MNALKRKHTIKKAAAASLAVALSLSAFGMNSGYTPVNSAINTAAAENKDTSSYDKQLKDLDEKKSQLDKKIAEAGSDIKGQQEKLDAIDEKVKTIKKKIDKLSEKSTKIEDEMCDLDAEMRSTKYELEQSEAEITQELDKFKDRLRAIYVAGNSTYPEVLLASQSFYDILMRIELVKRVAEHDNEILDALLEKKAVIEKYQAELDKQSADLKAKSAEYAAQNKKLIDQQTELLAMKQEFGDKIKSLEGDISDYTNEASYLSGEYNKLAEKNKTTASSASTTAKAETTGGKSTTTSKKTDKTDKTTKTTTSKTTTTKKTTTETKTEPETKTTTEKTTTESTTAKPKDPETTAATQPPETSASTTEATTAEIITTTEEPEPEPYIEPDPEPYDSDRETKINIVVNYAKGMVGGSYVWAGEQYGATDCSGLVMLSYRQIGINLPHYAASQAEYGTDVSYDELMPGDLVFFGGSSYSSIYHVAMYIGDGKIVHAESTDTGIVISYLSSVAQWNSITCMKRII